MDAAATRARDWASKLSSGRKDTEMQLRSRLAVAAITAALITVAPMIGAVGASAAPAEHHQVASASAGGDQSSFAAQARSAGLTGAQIAELQKEVNAYIRTYGGTQVAINKVDFRGGNITFAVPGQRYADAITSSGSATPEDADCPSQYFCAYSGTYFSGTKLEFYYCGDFYDMPFFGVGSYYNNQTEGDVATFWGADGNVVGHSEPAVSALSGYDWIPVYYVVPCALQ
jgi:hypothetical protein